MIFAYLRARRSLKVLKYLLLKHLLLKYLITKDALCVILHNQLKIASLITSGKSGDSAEVDDEDQ